MEGQAEVIGIKAAPGFTFQGLRPGASTGVLSLKPISRNQEKGQRRKNKLFWSAEEKRVKSWERSSIQIRCSRPVSLNAAAATPAAWKF